MEQAHQAENLWRLGFRDIIQYNKLYLQKPVGEFLQNKEASWLGYSKENIVTLPLSCHQQYLHLLHMDGEALDG